MVVTSRFSELVSTKKGLNPQWGGLPYKKDGELVVNFEKKTLWDGKILSFGRAMNFLFTSKRNQLNQKLDINCQMSPVIMFWLNTL